MSIEQLQKLLDEATPGPCELLNDDWACAIKVGDVYMQAPYQPPHGRGECKRWRADGALFAAARNALPALLKVAEAAQRLVNPGTLPACLTEQARFHTNAMVELGKALSELEAQ